MSSSAARVTGPIRTSSTARNGSPPSRWRPAWRSRPPTGPRPPTAEPSPTCRALATTFGGRSSRPARLRPPLPGFPPRAGSSRLCSVLRRPPVPTARSTPPAWWPRMSGPGRRAPSSTAAGAAPARSETWPGRRSGPSRRPQVPTSGRRCRRPRSNRNGRRWQRPGRRRSPPSRRGPAPSSVWTTSGPPSTLGVAWHPVLAALAVHREGTKWVAEVRRAVADALAQPQSEARQVAAEADLARSRAAESLTATEARLAEVEAQSEARPRASRFRAAERDPAAGAPFYELVDLAAGVAPDDAAGLEAALEAAGLLDAWVSADGLVVHPGTHDTLLHVGGTSFPAGTATLADVLVPAAAGRQPGGSRYCCRTAAGGRPRRPARRRLLGQPRRSMGARSCPRRLAQGHSRVPRGGRPAGNP